MATIVIVKGSEESQLTVTIIDNEGLGLIKNGHVQMKILLHRVQQFVIYGGTYYLVYPFLSSNCQFCFDTYPFTLIHYIYLFIDLCGYYNHASIGHRQFFAALI